jgi:hypothetical protein
VTTSPFVFRFTSPDVLRAPPVCSLVTVPDLVGSVERWAARCPPGPAVLTLDLTPVEVWEMTVLRPLVWARRRCLRAGADAVLVLPEAPVFRPGEVAVLRQLFTCLDASAQPAGDETAGSATKVRRRTGSFTA